MRLNSLFLHSADADNGAAREILGFVCVSLGELKEGIVLRPHRKHRRTPDNEAEKTAGAEGHKDDAKRYESGTGPDAAFTSHSGYLPA